MATPIYEILPVEICWVVTFPIGLSVACTTCFLGISLRPCEMALMKPTCRKLAAIADTLSTGLGAWPSMSFHVLPLTCIICINLIFTYVQGMWLGRRSTTSCCVAYKMSPSFEARWSRSWRKSRRLVGTLFTRSLCLYWLIWLFLTFSDIIWHFLQFSDNLAMYKLTTSAPCDHLAAAVTGPMSPSKCFVLQLHPSIIYQPHGQSDHSWMNSLALHLRIIFLVLSVHVVTNNQTVLCLFQCPWTYGLNGKVKIGDWSVWLHTNQDGHPLFPAGTNLEFGKTWQSNPAVQFNLRQKLQNLSHQLRILHGDAELIRAAARGAQTLGSKINPWSTKGTGPLWQEKKQSETLCSVPGRF